MKRLDPSDLEASYRRVLTDATAPERALAVALNEIGNAESLMTPVGPRQPGEPAPLYLEMALAISRDGYMRRLIVALCRVNGSLSFPGAALDVGPAAGG